MNTTKKGKVLENRLYEYLLEQKEKGQLIYGIYAPSLCKIYKQKQYYCMKREGNITFDVVVEICREVTSEPHSKLIFECKNYTKKTIPESDVTDFSNKLSRIGMHDTKGIIITNTELQIGAKNLAESYHIGIAKFNNNGLEIVAERRSKQLYQDKHLKKQLFGNQQYTKSLKFSAYYDGKYHGSVQSLISWIISPKIDDKKTCNSDDVPFISHQEMEQKANKLLKCVQYREGAINLEEICSYLSIGLEWDSQQFFGDNGSEILGKADFSNKKITIYSHDRITRERFTISHEIGHFYLRHDKFLLSESIVKQDLFIGVKNTNKSDIDKLEYQANLFASCLLLPRNTFLRKTDEFRAIFDIRNKGHGDIYVDDQPCNISDFNKLLGALSDFFQVSTQAIEIRLKTLNKLVDERQQLTPW
ncbi:hypothetical protein WH96_18030 [Kiloniella spongiae]|uniref:IrrE N-terminal-like domain-containing protein n=1 Tax=Kiloniella spongiae TaxID=1489064 RepID=A0A0H2MB62_9PROT|nr:ImmA/IrrE family metallo-endopeptidase [Kiloniella spongiae]KLN59396.1 hypothetical protein WH96_18030 [Kiloniella spongiae]